MIKLPFLKGVLSCSVAPASNGRLCFLLFAYQPYRDKYACADDQDGYSENRPVGDPGDGNGYQREDKPHDERENSNAHVQNAADKGNNVAESRQRPEY